MTGGSMTGGSMTGGSMTGGSIRRVDTGGSMTGGSEAGDTSADELLSCGELIQCGATCVDLMSDPNNCGRCGRTCVIPNAEANCLAGQCAIDQCLGEYQNIDEQLSNGCETISQCEPDQPCMSSCGSEGRAYCVDEVSECEPPPESCNLQDDDCDGVCDEGWTDLGCRVGVHRGYGRGEHIYSTELALVTGDGHNLERENYFYLYAETQPNTRPVFYCQMGNNRPFLSTQTNCGIGRAPIRTLGFWLADPTCGASPLYFLTKDTDSDFFYTTSAMERDYAVTLGYVAQGVAGYIWLP